MRNQELAEVLDQQAATSAILDAISASPGDLKSVFNMIARSAKKLCHARFCGVFQFDGKLIHFCPKTMGQSVVCQRQMVCFVCWMACLFVGVHLHFVCLLCVTANEVFACLVVQKMQVKRRVKSQFLPSPPSDTIL